MDSNATKVFELQQKHAFGILVANVKESSALPFICHYSDPNATNYGDAISESRFPLQPRIDWKTAH